MQINITKILRGYQPGQHLSANSDVALQGTVVLSIRQCNLGIIQLLFISHNHLLYAEDENDIDLFFQFQPWSSPVPCLAM